jgi:hypothetical protein
MRSIAGTLGPRRRGGLPRGVVPGWIDRVGKSLPGVERAADAAGAQGHSRGDADLVIWTDAPKIDAVKAVAEAFAEAANGISVEVEAVSSDLETNFVTANAATTARTSSWARTTGSATSCRTAERCDRAVAAHPGDRRTTPTRRSRRRRTTASCTACPTAPRAVSRPDSWLLAEHGHDATLDLDGRGWHGTMDYAGFTSPVWSWLSGGGPIGPGRRARPDPPRPADRHPGPDGTGQHGEHARSARRHALDLLGGLDQPPRLP